MSATVVGLAWGMTALGVTGIKRNAKPATGRTDACEPCCKATATIQHVPVAVGWHTHVERVQHRCSQRGSNDDATLQSVTAPSRTQLPVSPTRIDTRIDHQGSEITSSSMNCRTSTKQSDDYPARAEQTAGETQMSPVLTSVRLQSQVIHALHGVSPSGDWFLMADVGSRHADDAKLRGVDELPLDDTWIVIVGQRDRDIITTQDATD